MRFTLSLVLVTVTKFLEVWRTDKDFMSLHARDMRNIRM
ncbi:putative minor structural protein [Salmonella phage 41]|nr:putative minor structural protein [Salmonella phage 41]